MTPIPKPARRGRKPRRPIPRVHAGGRRSRVPRALAEYRAWEREADRLWREGVKRQAGGDGARCQFGGCVRRGTQAHHLTSRRYRQTRWLLCNGAWLCGGCHLLVTQDGEENRALALRLIGEERWEQLQIAKHCRSRIDPRLAAIALRAAVRMGGGER